MPNLVGCGTANEVWLDMIRKIYESGVVVKPRGLRCKEILANTTRVNMHSPITTVRPRLGYKFLIAEAWWIISGRNDVASMRKYSSHYPSFSNDGIRFDGAYGPRIIDQLRYVCDALETDAESRQAVIEIWRPNPRVSRDIPCTIALQWMIRKIVDGAGVETHKLHCFDTMRSSDAWLGWPYDVFNFSMLSAYIALVLRERATKNEGADHLRSLQLGTLHLTAASQHLYMNPKEDGATNIPYSIADVENVMNNFTSLRDKGSSYCPLYLEDFESAQEFLEHLERSKDGIVDKQWLAEFK